MDCLQPRRGVWVKPRVRLCEPGGVGGVPAHSPGFGGLTRGFTQTPAPRAQTLILHGDVMRRLRAVALALLGFALAGPAGGVSGQDRQPGRSPAAAPVQSPRLAALVRAREAG